MVQAENLQRHTLLSGAQQALMNFGVRMISELNREFLVCVQNGRIFMQETRRWLAAAALCTLIALSNGLYAADEPGTSDASAYVLQAEMALQRQDYLKAIQEYRKAAELSSDPDVARQAAITAMTYGFDDEALIAARRWYELDPESDEVTVVLAQINFRLGDVRAAKKYFGRLLDKSKEPPGEKLLMLVRYLSDEGNPEDADQIVRSLARPYSDSALANYAVAMMALQAGDTDYAKERAARAIELDPDGLKARLLYARILLASGEMDKAIEYTALLVGDDPDPDPDARMELAIMYMMADRTDDALSQVNQILLEQSGRMDALRLMAIINFHEGHLDAAWDDFNDLLASGQYRLDALYYLGRIADYREEYDRAVSLYAQVRHGSNALPSQQRAAALLAYEMEDVDSALQILDEFALAAPSFAVDASLAKAQLLAVAEDYDAALKLYDKAVQYRPDDERVVLSRADVLLRMGRIDDALDVYAKAVKRWPKSALVLNAYGYTLADRTDRYREAEKLIRKALKFDPENPAIIDSMGWVLFKLERYEEALAELEKAYEGMADHEVAAHIVETLMAMGKKDEALERLVAAEEETPDSPLLEDIRKRLFPDGS
jgi:tetratricopeptide (TPR) repeat protein